MAKTANIPYLTSIVPATGITLDTGLFDFSPDPPEDEIIKKLRELPKESYLPLLEWVKEKRPFLVPGRKFDIEKHKYLVDLYRCEAKDLVVMKSGQAGVSEFLVSYAAWTCDMRNGTVLYIFPTDKLVSDFSTARFGPAIEASSYLSKIVVSGSGSGGMKGSDRITLKRIRDRFLYFRGSLVDTEGNASQLKSIDADILILDEVDELDQRAPAIAKKRLGHAREDLGNVLWVSTPTYPGYGIDAEFEETDQRLWHIPCPHCGEKQPLSIDSIVLEWDDLGRPVAWNGYTEGKAWVGCRSCGKPMDRLADGEWVAKHPGRSRVGFHLTKLFSPYNNLLEVVHNLDNVDETKKREAYNQDLGVPYVPKGGSLTSEEIDACRREYGHGPDPYTTCYMGIDVGNVLHVVVRTMADFLTHETRQLYAGEANWESLHNLVKIYRPATIVIDARPEATKAREFQEMYSRNMVWVAYYPTQAAGSKNEDIAQWNVMERHVTLDRTRVLDRMFAGFYGRKSTLPAHARNIRDYYSHMRASIRIEKEIGTSGIKVATYIDNRKPDHYAHAEVFCLAASMCKVGIGWVQGAAV